ncbi:MAG TPA: hypothetical protein DDZ53_04400 [Firmicutes bacterium]|nr:hypothetical protein [Bacillota bacterium]
MPRVGATVKALNRAGEVVGQGTVIKVQTPPAFDRTAVIHLAVAKTLAHEVRNIVVEDEANDA